MKTPSLEIYKDAANEHRWRVKHGNGKILAAASEGFARKSGAKLNFKRVRAALLAITACLLLSPLFAEAQLIDTNTSALLSQFQGATNIAVIPFMKYDLTSKNYGYGVAALYKVTDNFWSGLRIDRINGFNTTAGVQAQLKANMDIMGLTFHPFVETSVGIGSSSLYGSAGTGAFVKLFSHDWARTGRPPVSLYVAAIADYEHVVQSGSDTKNSNQINAGPMLSISF